MKRADVFEVGKAIAAAMIATAIGVGFALAVGVYWNGWPS